MEIIFLIFANNREAPLDTLQEEDQEVYKIVSNRSKMDGFQIHRESFAKIREVNEYLLLYQEQIVLFLFSGHAGRDRLLLEDEVANASGIAEQLGNCPNLKLVVLNGCSTQGQVEHLLNAGVPAVIATSAPVEDKKATQFSISFFQSLCHQYKSIQEAFNDGIAAAKTIGLNTIQVHRGLFQRSRLVEKVPLWGLYHAEGNAFALEWRLQSGQSQAVHFEPNNLLLKNIWEAIQAHLSPENRNRLWNRNDKLDLIITRLPHPISEFLRKLIALPTPGEREEAFYHELGFNRLKFLVYTYITCIELLAVTLLAQLWDECENEQITTIPDELKKEIEQLFRINFRARRSHSFLPLIQKIRDCFEAKQIEFFMKEFKALSLKFKTEDPFYQACVEIEKTRNLVMEVNTLETTQAKGLCVEVEKQLSLILKELGFLVKYDMASMKQINFIKYKHQRQPTYQHNFVQLNYRPSGMDVVSETLQDSMDNGSVILIHYEADKFNYLNLSPFIIDENAFDEKAKLASICIFQSFEKMANAFTFRFVYKPLANMLIVNRTKDYFPLIRDQFNAFSNLIFKQTLLEP